MTFSSSASKLDNARQSENKEVERYAQDRVMSSRRSDASFASIMLHTYAFEGLGRVIPHLLDAVLVVLHGGVSAGVVLLL